jgi:tetratricopeptide (TPR) repeat protein
MLYVIEMLRLKKPIILVFIFLNSAFCLGQDCQTDSLLHLISSKHCMERYEPMLTYLRIEFDRGEYDKSLSLALELRTLATEAGDTVKMIESGRICGQMYNYQEMYNESMNILLETLALVEKCESVDYENVLNNLGIAYLMTSHYDKALDLHLKSLSIAVEQTDTPAIACAYNNIGNAYYRMSRYKTASAFFIKGEALAHAIDDEHLKRSLPLNIGHSLVAQLKYDSAITYFHRALAGAQVKLTPGVVSGAKNGLAKVHLGLGIFEEAEAFAVQALRIAEAACLQSHLSENYYLLGKVKLAQNEFDSAVLCLKIAEQGLLAQKNREMLILTYALLADTYKKLGDKQEYLYNLTKYIAMKDSVYKWEVLQNLANVEAGHVKSESESQIGKREERIAKQESYIFILGGVLVFGVGLVVILRRNVAFSRQVTEVLIKNLSKKTLDLSAASASIQEKEGQLSTFVHRTSNDIRAPLATLKGVCNVAMLDVKDETSKLYLTRISETTQKLEWVLERLGKSEAQSVFVKPILDESIKKFQRTLTIESHVDEDFSLPIPSARLSSVLDDVLSTLASGIDGGSVTMTIRNSGEKSLHIVVTTNASNFALDELTQRLSIVGVRVLVSGKDNVTELSLVF